MSLRRSRRQETYRALLDERDLEQIIYGVPQTTAGRLRLVFVAAALMLLTAGTSALALSRSDASAPAVAAATESTMLRLPGCQPTAAYRLPAAISLAPSVTGAYVRVDPADSYSVSGTTPTGIMDNIARCTPVRQDGLFAANTGYTLSSFYSYRRGTAGTCRIVSASVALHINQVFPAWQRPADATAATSADWDTFITNLHTHEQGHINLDKAYAQKLYSVLSSLPPLPCDGFKDAINNAANRVSDGLIDANNVYDTTTQHGTTQGAVL